MIGNLDDMLRDTAQVTDNTDRGKCSGCGECCSDFLPISTGEIKRIHKYVKDHDIKEKKNNIMHEGFDFICPFRDNVKKECTIYEVRPAICREFKCDYSPARLATNKKFFHSRYKAVSMRLEFFGNKGNVDMLGAVYAAFAGLTRHP